MSRNPPNAVVNVTSLDVFIPVPLESVSVWDRRKPGEPILRYAQVTQARTVIPGAELAGGWLDEQMSLVKRTMVSWAQREAVPGVIRTVLGVRYYVCSIGQALDVYSAGSARGAVPL